MTNAIGTIRPFTTDDEAALTASALRVPVSADITVAYGYVGYRAA
jgi:hypothetical protein